MTGPRVSVVMPVFDEERYVEQAVRSILDQTVAELELIVIDDGSTDRTPEILERLAAEDARVLVVRQTHAGVVASLNLGLDLARAPFVARMDADDLALPLRLEKQLRQLEARPELTVLGSYVRYVDAEGEPVGEWRVPTGVALVRWSLCFGTALAHPTVVIRRAGLGADRYSTVAPHAEDYELWARLARRTEIDNLDEVLVERRVHGGSVSDRNVAVQERSVRAVIRLQVADLLGSPPTDTDVESLLRATTDPRRLGVARAMRAAILIHRLSRAFRARCDPADARVVAADAMRRVLVVLRGATRVRSR